MKFLTRFFKKRSQKQDIYAHMGSIGISPKHMLMYQDSTKKIEEYQKKWESKPKADFL